MRSTTWGNWTFERRNLTLNHKHGYSIDLESCKNPAQVLDWIMQVRAKAWTDSRDVTELLDALDEILGVQANVCRNGRDAEIDPKTLINERGYVVH